MASTFSRAASSSACRRPDLVNGRRRSSPRQSPRSPAFACRMTYAGTVGLAGFFQVVGAQQRAVASVTQEIKGFIDGGPSDLIDLASRLEAPAHDLHQEITRDLVPAFVIGIGSAANGHHDLAAQSRLLFDLSQRRLFQRLPAVELALGE